MYISFFQAFLICSFFNSAFLDCCFSPYFALPLNMLELHIVISMKLNNSVFLIVFMLSKYAAVLSRASWSSTRKNRDKKISFSFHTIYCLHEYLKRCQIIDATFWGTFLQVYLLLQDIERQRYSSNIDYLFLLYFISTETHRWRHSRYLEFKWLDASVSWEVEIIAFY